MHSFCDQSQVIMSRLTLPSSILAVLLVLLSCTTALAATAVIDDASSFIEIQGTLSNGQDTLPITPQPNSSSQTQLSGTLQVDITPTSITLLGGGLVLASIQSGSFLPNGGDANFAGQVVDILPGITAVASVRNFTFEILGGPIPLNPDGTFDTTGLIAVALGGTFDYEIPGLLGPATLDIYGQESAGSLVGKVELLPNGKHQVTIPYEVTFGLISSTTSFSLELVNTGQIVAITPEPSSYLLAAIGSIGWAAITFRRKRR
jgi:hypothetical protein